MPKILLSTLNAKYIHLNLAIRILYDLNKDHADLAWKEFVIKNDPLEVAQQCQHYDVVAFSCYIWNIVPTLNVCRAIKALNPSTKILLGGPEVSYEWETVIAEECVDFIITGEGEVPFEAFVKSFPDVLEVPNLIYKADGHIHYNKQAVQFDVQLLANRNPYQYDAPEDLYNKVCYIETSRGCPYKCEFCLASLDNKVRYLPTDTIKQNLLYLMTHGRVIKFLDRTFNVKKDFTIDIFEFILEHHRPENVFQFEITADIVHPDIIAFIQARVPKGLFRFEIGIQTVNKESNLAVSRKQNFDKTASVIKQLDNKIEMHLDLIVGLPLEYWDDLKYSFESTFKLYPPELQLGFLKFLKGTPVREKYEQYGYIFDPLPPYQIIESQFLSKQELKAITELEDALEIYWNKKRAIYTLQYWTEYYSIFDALRGLGTYFHQHSNPHQHTVKDIYGHLMAFAKNQYQDAFLEDLITIDYYLYHKIKPQDVFQRCMSTKDMHAWIEANQLDHFNHRFVALQTKFDVHTWLKERQLVPAIAPLFIQFDGQDKAKIVTRSLKQPHLV